MISKIWNPIPRDKFSPISFNPYVPQVLKDYKLKKKENEKKKIKIDVKKSTVETIEH